MSKEFWMSPALKALDKEEDRMKENIVREVLSGEMVAAEVYADQLSRINGYHQALLEIDNLVSSGNIFCR